MPGLRPGSFTGAGALCEATLYCHHQIDGRHNVFRPKFERCFSSLNR
jgi:hypothetical protein